MKNGRGNARNQFFATHNIFWGNVWNHFFSAFCIVALYGRDPRDIIPEHRKAKHLRSQKKFEPSDPGLLVAYFQDILEFYKVSV